MLKIIVSNRFKKDYRLAKKQKLDVDLLKNVVKILACEEILPKKYCDHALSRKYENLRECHIKPNWLLIYSIDVKTKILRLARTGAHSNLLDV